MDIYSPQVSAGLLGGSFIWELSLDRPQYQRALRLNQLVLLIAAASYTLISLYPDYESELRYLDWFITTPLLLTSYFLVVENFLNLDRKLLNQLVIADLLMIATGALAKFYLSGAQRTVALFLSFAFLAYILWQLWQITVRLGKSDNPTAQKLQKIFVFFGLWIIYGLGYFSSQATTLYSTLDVAAKAGFSLSLWTLV